MLSGKNLPPRHKENEPSTNEHQTVGPAGITLFSNSRKMSGNDEQLTQAIKKSLETAKNEVSVGPREIDGLVLEDVEDDGNCLYRAVAKQLKIIRHHFLDRETAGIEAHDRLRLLVQGDDFRDREWGDFTEILVLADKLSIRIGIVDTRDPKGEMIYYGVDSNGKAHHTKDRDELFGDPIIQLAYTGNHYLSVLGASYNNETSGCQTILIRSM